MKNKKKKTPGFNEIECPNCGKILNKNAVFCYTCNSFLTDDGKELLSPEKVTNQDIQKLLDQSREDKKKNDQTVRGKIGRFFCSMAWISFFLMLILSVFSRVDYEVACLGVALIFFILNLIISPPDVETQLDAKEIEEIVTKYIAAVECKNIYGCETFFEPESALPEALIIKTSFCNQGYTKYEGNRLIRGSWKGYPFSACHVKLMNFHSRNGYKDTINIFDGYCMSIDTNLIFPENIRIIEKHMGCLTQIVKEDKEESALFDEVYNVKSEDIDVANDFLTPELRKNIILTGRQYAGKLSIVLNPNGNVFIAAGGGEDAFEENQSAEEIRAKYRKELEFPLKVLQCFLDAENIG